MQPAQHQSPRHLVDLHRHLDGSLRRSTLHELARAQGLEIPNDILFYEGMGLEGALSRFAITLSVLQQPEAVRRVAAEICEDAAREGVDALEIRFAPQLHRGGSPEAVIDAALEGINKRAGLILCGLFGEPPSVLENLVAKGRTRSGVVGIDLAGGPSGKGEVELLAYAPAFTAARDAGLGRTVHAAEGRSSAEIRVAIETLHAQRIGHGTTLLEDPEVLGLVVDRGITVEACPTSNVHTGVIANVREHPLPHWLRLGVSACVCTDNTLFSAVDAPTEHARALSIPGMTEALLAQAIEHGHRALFSRR